MPTPQALLSENEQLGELACSQETISRILEDERRHRDRLAGGRAMLSNEEPIDEEVAGLVDRHRELALCETPARPTT
jgi:hypothetical protein